MLASRLHYYNIIRASESIIACMKHALSMHQVCIMHAYKQYYKCLSQQRTHVLALHPPRHAGCLGNRLEWVPGSDNKRLLANFPHHKNERRWDYMSIDFELPSTLVDVIMPWVQEGHALVAKDSHYLFVQPNTLGLFGSSYFSNWFMRLHSSFPNICTTFAPSNLRHVFVDERRGGIGEDPPEEGPSDWGAARAMGNSEARWDTSYDRHRHARELQAAVGAMDTWRERLLNS